MAIVYVSPGIGVQAHGGTLAQQVDTATSEVWAIQVVQMLALLASAALPPLQHRCPVVTYQCTARGKLEPLWWLILDTILHP